MTYKFYCWSAYDPLFKGYQMVESYFDEDSKSWKKIDSYEIAYREAKGDVSKHHSVSTHVLGSNDGDTWYVIETFGRKNPYRRKCA